jgi:hypothetical protein
VYSKASGVFSTSVGAYSRATGVDSAVFGVKAEATADSATALGPFSLASAPASTAMGYRTKATGYGQTVVGLNNIAIGNATNPDDLESEVFVVGSGKFNMSTGASTPANALTIKRNGNTWVKGGLVIDGGPSTAPSKTIIKRDVDVSGVLRVRPTGDLNMGGFVSGPAPAAP